MNPENLQRLFESALAALGSENMLHKVANVTVSAGEASVSVSFLPEDNDPEEREDNGPFTLGELPPAW